MDNHFVMWFIIAGIAAAIPVPLIKTYTDTNDSTLLVLSIVSYLVLIKAYTIVLADQNMSVIYPFIKITSIVLVVMFGIILFGDKSTVNVSIGVLLGLVSIYLLSLNVTP